MSPWMLHVTPRAAAPSPLCRQQRRIQKTRPLIPLIARRAAAAAAAADADADAATTTTTSSSSASPSTTTTTTTTTTRPVLIVFDLDNASIPSQAASAVVAILARKMRSILFDEDDKNNNNITNTNDDINTTNTNNNLSVRAEAFANEVTVRNRPDLALSLREAGIPLVTVPSSIRNAADAMVVSCASRAMPALRAGGGGLVLIGNDTNAYADFLRFASSKGVRTLVAGDFDHGRRSGRRGGRRRWEGGSSNSNSRSGSDVDVEVDDGDGIAAAAATTTVPPWRRKELPAAADHAVLWCDVLMEARELIRVA